MARGTNSKVIYFYETAIGIQPCTGITMSRPKRISSYHICGDLVTSARSGSEKLYSMLRKPIITLGK